MQTTRTPHHIVGRLVGSLALVAIVACTAPRGAEHAEVADAGPAWYAAHIGYVT